MMVMMMAVVLVMIILAEKESAQDIDGKAKHGNRNGFIEADRDRRKNALHRLISDEERDETENDRACKAGQLAELAGAERKARVMGVLAGEPIGETSN